jgi:hypothetical protein
MRCFLKRGEERWGKEKWKASWRSQADYLPTKAEIVLLSKFFAQKHGKTVQCLTQLRIESISRESDSQV